MDVTDFIVQTNDATSAEELYGILERALADLCGYDRVIFSLMSDHVSLGLRAGHGIMRNYPDDWMQHYVAKGYEHIDPVRQFGFSHVGPFIWDSLPLVMSLSSGQDICMNQCREAGFYNGAAVCLRGLTGELGGIGVASSSQKKSDNEREAKYKIGLLNVITQGFYAAYCNLHQDQVQHEPREVVLTTREIEIVKHLAMAKKDDAIAFDLNMTRHTVNFHTRNIMKKFNAPNRIAAILRAVNSGLLGIDDAVFIRESSKLRPNRRNIALKRGDRAG